MLVLVLFAFIGLFLVINYFLKKRHFLALAAKIPGIKGEVQIPLIGIFPRLIGADLHDLFTITYNIFKNADKLLKIWFGPELIVGVTSPELIQQVLNSKECLDKPDWYRFFGIQQGSLFGTYDAWKNHRKILNPAFNYQILKDFVPIFDKKSRILMKILHDECEGKKEFNIYPYMSIFFIETVLSAGLDYEVDIQTSGKRDDYVEYLEG